MRMMMVENYIENDDGWKLHWEQQWLKIILRTTMVENDIENSDGWKWHWKWWGDWPGASRRAGPSLHVGRLKSLCRPEISSSIYLLWNVGKERKHQSLVTLWKVLHVGKLSNCKFCKVHVKGVASEALKQASSQDSADTHGVTWLSTWPVTLHFLVEFWGTPIWDELWKRLRLSILTDFLESTACNIFGLIIVQYSTYMYSFFSSIYMIWSIVFSKYWYEEKAVSIDCTL